MPPTWPGYKVIVSCANPNPVFYVCPYASYNGQLNNIFIISYVCFFIGALPVTISRIFPPNFYFTFWNTNLSYSG